MINNRLLGGTIFVFMDEQLYLEIMPATIEPRSMKMKDPLEEQLNACLAVRQQAANELQEEVNQILASALLWIRFAKTGDKELVEESVDNAAVNLQIAIERVRALYSTLTQEI